MPLLLALASSLFLSSSQIPVDQPPRLRTVLDNGAIVLVEPMRSPAISVQLFASAKYVPETEATHGYRHLLEHLIARGDGSLDRRLESQGCFLTARTLRDAMQFEVTVGENQLPLAFEALGAILRKPEITQERIDKELRVMRDELALQDDALKLAASAWSQAFGEQGLDPMGTFDSMYRATPMKLADTFQRQFAGDGLVVAIAGPVDLDKATTMAKAFLSPFPKGHFEIGPVVRNGKPGRTQSEGFGEARAAIVPGFDSPRTMATLAAGLAVAGEFDSAFLIYTPSARSGLIIIGRTDSNGGVGLYIDGLTNGSALYERGKRMAREWVDRQLRSPQGVAYLRGLLLCQGLGYRPETMLTQIDAMTPAAFDEGLKGFTEERAVTAVGSR